LWRGGGGGGDKREDGEKKKNVNEKMNLRVFFINSHINMSSKWDTSTLKHMRDHRSRRGQNKRVQNH